MSVRVITPPALLIDATQAKVWAPVLASDADERVTALLRVAQAAIEPPNGWTGRAFGTQTLEATFRSFRAPCLFLPAPPLREVVSVTYRDEAGLDQTIPADLLSTRGVGTSTGSVAMAAGAAWPGSYSRHEEIRVRFTAGYFPTDPVLNPVLQAIVLGAVQLRSLGSQDLSLRSEEVAGVGTTTWTVSDVAEKLVRTTVENLLAPFQVYA